jgi:acyl carrier protein
VAPRNDTEQQIAGIWCEVLGVDGVGIDDNFFDLGGNSLLVMRVRRQLEKSLGYEIAIVDLFDYATVRTLSRYCAVQYQGGAVKTGSSSLSKVQERALQTRKVMRLRGKGIFEDSTQ